PSRRHMARLALALIAMVGDEVKLTPGSIALDLDQFVGDHMLGGGVGLAQLIDAPGHEIRRLAIEQSVIVDRVGMVHAAQQFLVHAIDGAAITHHHLMDFLLVQHHPQGRFALRVDTHGATADDYFCGLSYLPWYSGMLKDGPSCWRLSLLCRS